MAGWCSAPATSEQLAPGHEPGVSARVDELVSFPTRPRSHRAFNLQPALPLRLCKDHGPASCTRAEWLEKKQHGRLPALQRVKFVPFFSFFLFQDAGLPCRDGRTMSRRHQSCPPRGAAKAICDSMLIENMLLHCMSRVVVGALHVLGHQATFFPVGTGSCAALPVSVCLCL